MKTNNLATNAMLRPDGIRIQSQSLLAPFGFLENRGYESLGFVRRTDSQHM